MGLAPVTTRVVWLSISLTTSLRVSSYVRSFAPWTSRCSCIFSGTREWSSIFLTGSERVSSLRAEYTRTSRSQRSMLLWRFSIVLLDGFKTFLRRTRFVCGLLGAYLAHKRRQASSPIPFALFRTISMGSDVRSNRLTKTP